MHIHLDPLGGIAGDMFVAAILDAWPELATGLGEAVAAAGLPEGWTAAAVAHSDGTLAGTRFEVRGPARSRPSGAFAAIRERLRHSSLTPAAAARAIAIFGLLAAAESVVHGVAADDVHFHEIADWDSLADIAAAAWLIEALASQNPHLSWSVAALPIGSGRVQTAHGPMPVPAPATAKLIEGRAIIDDGIGGERVTPTGAAILRHLDPTSSPGSAGLKVARSGHGFGQRTLPGISNVLRVLAFESVEAGWTDEQIAVIAFEIDDQTPEDLAVGIEAIRGAVGVLDVTHMPVNGKKGRIAASVRVLCRRESLDQAIERCFGETTTIGLRWSWVQRAVLTRQTVPDPQAARNPKSAVRVKVARRPHGPTAKAEIDDVSEAGAGRPERQRRRRIAEAAALKPKRGAPRER